MDTRISFDVRDDHLRVSLDGAHQPALLRGLLQQIRDAADASGRVRILIDATGIVSPLSDPERYAMGELVAELFRKHYKVAVVYRPDWITKFAENVAVNRGAQLVVVASEAEALDWLAH